MKVSRFPMDPGPAAWNAILPATLPRPTLKKKVTADWLIVGAGFTGLSAARRLSQLHPRDRIVVLDATRVAEGPAGRNSGFMIDVPHDLTTTDYGGNAAAKDQRDIRLNRAGINYALEAKAAYAMSNEVIATCGKINGAITARGVAHNAAYARHLQNLSEPYERLDAAAMQLRTGTACYMDGLYTPGTVMIQPAMYMRELAAGVESNQVSIYENSPVLELERAGSAWRARTKHASVTAPKVVLAVNGHLESFGFFKRQLVHVFTYGSMTQALTQTQVKQLGGDSEWALTPADALGTTVRRTTGTGGDRIVIRNRATYDPTLRVSASRIEQIARDHDRSWQYRFPMLKDVRMEYRWGGRLCLSRNNVPVFGEVENALYVACCQNGLGTAKGTISGKLVAELASAQSSSLLDDLLADEEPTNLPPEPFASVGAKLVLRWGEFRAGREL